MAERPRLSGQKKLGAQDVTILEGLALHDVRNISQLSERLNMPRPTLRYRIKYLRSHFSLGLYGSIYHTFIGLRKVLVFVDAKPGYEDLLYDCLKANDYWLYVSQCIEATRCLAIYGIPAGKEKKFEEFMGRLQELGLAGNVTRLWSTCIQNINATFAWLDRASGKWGFPWDSWIKEVMTNKGELPYTLQEPDEYVQKADWIDIMILKELEKDCTVKLKEIARKLDMSLQRLRYHYKNHVIQKGMFEGIQVIAEYYSECPADLHFFTFSFESRENLTKLACSLMYKPFAKGMGKEYGRNRLFAQIYLPREQLRNFIGCLGKLVRAGFLETYYYVIQDPVRKERQTISYEFFRDGKWEYNDKAYLEKLQSIVKRAG